MNRFDKIRVTLISPYLLCQEIYLDNPWRMMVCCILLNRTTGVQVHKIREQLFELWPNAYEMSVADIAKLAELIRPLGLYNKRANDIVRFSREWIGEWSDVRELHGIGRYARDSYSIFVERDYAVKPTDKVLRKYLEWKNKTTYNEDKQSSVYGSGSHDSQTKRRQEVS